jgi:hypothetical protein
MRDHRATRSFVDTPPTDLPAYLAFLLAAQ